ncbi:MAG: ferredoxin [Bacteroidetes bacterium]|nr:MAG: ferredoxin [Bacteroidota bacterium]
MITIHVKDTDGSRHTLETEVNPTANLMELLTEHRMDVAAICGGMASCGTCHVGFMKGGETLDNPEDDEAFMLETLPNYRPESRLSCQIPLTEALDGAEIEVWGDTV